MLSYFKSGFLIVVRSRNAQLFCGAVVVVLLSSVLSALFSGRQPVTVAVDVGFSLVRFFLPFFAVFLVQDLIFKEFEGRSFLGALSYPKSRLAFLSSRFFVVVVCLFFFLFLLLFSVFVLSVVLGFFFRQDVVVGFVGEFSLLFLFYFVESVFVAALACFLSVIASSQGFILVGVVGGVVAARSYSYVVSLFAVGGFSIGGGDLYRSSMDVLFYFLPDLGALDVRAVVLYGKMEFLPSDWFFLLVSCMVYSLGIFFLTAWAINRKRLN